jgi:type I restriction enzyme R subunit
MALTDINSEDRLVQQTFAEHLEHKLGWESIYAWNTETFGPAGTLGRASEREAVLVRDLRAALERLNPDIPASAREQAIEKLTHIDFARSLIQHNKEFYGFIRGGVPVEWRDTAGETRHAHARAIDFRDAGNNRFLAVRELKLQGVRVPHYNRRADLVCFVNGLPLVFIELKAVYKNIRAGFDDNLSDYMSEHSVAQAFHHNAFLVVSNGDVARYGSITSKWEHFVEWKRNDEKDKARLDAEALLDGMLARERLLDIVENFILFDDSRAGGTRKIVARNHQVLGVNNAVDSVLRQEALKREIPPEKRLLEYRVPMPDLRKAADPLDTATVLTTADRAANDDFLPMLKRAHADLGRLGVFWHTQGSGKSYSMAFFAEKVRRVVPGNFTFLVMTDREDLDDQIWRTFIGCGVTDEKTPRAGTGRELREILQGNHRYVFSLIHKFNQPVTEPYSERDDIIVVSDEAHRTQAGRFARNMRLALPNAAFIGFTGTPLFKHDELTKRIFGGYISRYDFKRSEEDQSTVRLVYENRGEKLGIARLDLNDRIAEAVERAELDPDQIALLEKLLGKDYEVITADDRLDKLADDFVEHCSTRWETGKSLLVCIDKITCARMFQRIRAALAGQTGAGEGADSPEGGGPGRGDGYRRAGTPDQGDRDPAWACAVDGIDDHRAHHQRGPERAPRLRQMGLRHHPPPHGDEEWLRNAGRQAGAGGGRLQGSEAPLPHRHRLRHVADGLRCGEPGHAIYRQTHEGPQPDAGHRPGQPRLSRQGLRRHRRLQRHAEKPARGAGAICPGR